MTRVIYACDVGSTRSRGGAPSNFAWARVEPESKPTVIGSSNIEALATALEYDIRRGYSVALGIESPLFVPVPRNVDDLGRGRPGEGNRPFSATAGAIVAILGMHQMAWLLRGLYESCGDMCTFSVNCQKWPPSASSQPLLFCWEAFVSGKTHAKSHLQHLQDAATAATAFLAQEHRLATVKDVTAEAPFSLVGAVALWSGWATDPDILHHPTVVIKPETPYQGEIDDDASAWL